jgi:hypothetical protein
MLIIFSLYRYKKNNIIEIYIYSNRENSLTFLVLTIGKKRGTVKFLFYILDNQLVIKRASHHLPLLVVAL